MIRVMERLLPVGRAERIADRRREEGIRVDSWLLLAVFALAGWGLVMLVSASIVQGERLGMSYYFPLRQGVAMLIGLFLAGVVVTRIPLARYVEARAWILLLAIFLLVLVLVPGVGREVNGAQRWIPLGLFNLQVAEVARLLILIWMAGYVATRLELLQGRPRGMFMPVLVLVAALLLMLMQPDFGTAAILGATVFLVAWLAGAHLPTMLLLSVAGLGLGYLAMTMESYRIERLVSFVDPWADPYGSGYQLANSLIAIGSGGLFGQGLGESVQKMFYLPEAHTDFIFSVLAEEFGLVGVMAVIGLYGMLVWRGLVIAQMAWGRGQFFGGALAWGITLWLGLQAFVNMGVSMGMLPTKGLTLPLMSYGGSSMIVSLVAVALLLRVYHEATHEPVRRRGPQGGAS
ncbi:MAG: putative lipid II flippase FtsW [Halothiobacillaceae bacterium]